MHEPDGIDENICSFSLFQSYDLKSVESESAIAEKINEQASSPIRSPYGDSFDFAHEITRYKKDLN